ncbi:hypothetical protein A2U01_0015567, partial [Trifolium medium]|nr:hypothetical protein [Trifolium medium]
MKQRGLGDPQDYPQILDEIMERKFAFLSQVDIKLERSGICVA